MRILFALHQFYPRHRGGTERVALNLARMAQHGGHQVHVLASEIDDSGTGRWNETTHEGVPVTVIPRGMLAAAADISFDTEGGVARDLAGWMRERKFDAMHLMHPMRMGSAVRAAQGVGLPYLVTLTDFFLPCSQINLVNISGELCPGPARGERCARDCLVPPWTPPAYANRYQQAHALLAAAADRVAPSAFVADRFRESFPELAFRVIPHGLDFASLGAHAAGESRPEADNALALVYVGNVIPQKGLDVLLRALALLPGAPLTLTVVGGMTGNDAYHSELRGLADERVRFLGHVPPDEVFGHLRRADLLCLPSRVPESFSLALHEATAAGVPALVSDRGAPAQHVAAHGCGRAVAGGDPQAWADALRELLAQPALVSEWRQRTPLPLRIEEEAFFYESLYRRMARAAT